MHIAEGRRSGARTLRSRPARFWIRGVPAARTDLGMTSPAGRGQQTAVRVAALGTGRGAARRTDGTLGTPRPGRVRCPVIGPAPSHAPRRSVGGADRAVPRSRHSRAGTAWGHLFQRLMAGLAFPENCATGQAITQPHEATVTDVNGLPVRATPADS